MRDTTPGPPYRRVPIRDKGSHVADALAGADYLDLVEPIDQRLRTIARAALDAAMGELGLAGPLELLFYTMPDLPPQPIRAPDGRLGIRRAYLDGTFVAEGRGVSPSCVFIRIGYPMDEPNLVRVARHEAMHARQHADGRYHGSAAAEAEAEAFASGGIGRG